MKIRELITYLEGVYEEEGDLEVFTEDPEFGCYYWTDESNFQRIVNVTKKDKGRLAFKDRFEGRALIIQ